MLQDEVESLTVEVQVGVMLLCVVKHALLVC